MIVQTTKVLTISSAESVFATLTSAVARASNTSLLFNQTFKA